MEKKILFLDFDGVLFDTLREVYLVNRALYLNKDMFDEIESCNYALFSKYKYLVYNIWMFYYFNPLIFNNNTLDIEKEFKKAILNRDIEKENKFCEQFLSIRKNLVLNHYDFWCNLEKPYEFFYEIKKLKEQGMNITVISKKNKKAIIERFESYDFHLDENKVFAREILDNYSSKGEFMIEYMNKNGFSGAIFVDDNINNLNSAKEYKNIQCILALWGNTEPNSIGYTQQEAIKKIKDFYLI